METDVMRAVLDAVDAGRLPRWVRAEWSGRGSILVVMPGYGPTDLDANLRALEAFQGMFPGGEVRRGHCLVRWSRGTSPIDRGDYLVRTDGGLIQFWFYMEHVHQIHHYQGEVTRGGTPSWRCGACRKPLTKTEARAAGLSPPLERKNVRIDRGSSGP